MECTELKMRAPEAYDIDIEADDIDVTDIVTVVWEIYQEEYTRIDEYMELYLLKREDGGIIPLLIYYGIVGKFYKTTKAIAVQIRIC